MGRPKLPPRFCSIDGCGEPVRARGMCNVHYRRTLRTGDPHTVKVIHGDPEARFWSKVTKIPDGCWLFTGCLSEHGYGLLGIGGNRNAMAHRWSYEHHIGPIPEGLHLDHLCRVRNCVNPDHLEPVTGAENTRRGAAFKTHCVHGHEYTPENTVIFVARVCRTCRTHTRQKVKAIRRDRRKASTAAG